MRALFDVNVLLALFDSQHTHHGRASTWWLANSAVGWASCPHTQNGFVRVISRPAYQRPVAISEALAALCAQTQRPDHEFWPDDISMLDAGIFDQSRILGPSQITDVYLLGLAVKNGGRLVTFDRGVPVRAVKGAEPRNLVILG